MARKIQHKRGLEANLPQLDEAEIAFTTDSKKPFIGSADGNVEIAKKKDVDEALANKANATTVQGLSQTLNAKADVEYVETELAKKADTTALETKADVTALETKADKEEVTTLSAQLADKASQADVTNAVAPKADKTYVDTELGKKATLSQVRKETTGNPIMLSELHTEVKTAMTGGSVPVVGVDAVGEENIKSKAVTSAKTTALGGLGVIYLDTNATLPNIDTVNKKLVLSGYFYVISKKKRDVFLNTVEIPFASGFSQVVLYDTDTQSFRMGTSGQTSSMVESEIILGTISFTSSAQTEVKSAWMTTSFTVDGVGYFDYMRKKDDLPGVIPPGDGVADDSARIQAEINKVDSGMVEFASGKTYVLDSSLTVDVAKVKLVRGNGARFLLKGNFPAFIIKGSKNDAGAGPHHESNQMIKTTEMVPIVEGLHIYPETHWTGTGISVSGTFGVIVRNNHLFELDKGLEFTGYNRNIMVAENHFWDNRINSHWNNTNIHQQNVLNNHFTAGEYGIYVEGGSIHNFQIVGNDVEGHVGYKNAINFTGSDFSQIQITGNSIEEHMAATGALIHMESANPRYFIATISGNELSGSKNGGVKIINGFSVNISTNNFVGIEGYAVHLAGAETRSCTINSNTIYNFASRQMGGFLVEVSSRIRELDISHNTGFGLIGKLLVVKGESDTALATLSGVSIDSNILSGYYSSSFTQTDDYIFEVGRYSKDTRDVSVRNNKLRGYYQMFTKGVLINTPVGNGTLVFIRENTLTGIVNMPEEDRFVLPAPVDGKIMVSDNYANIY